MSKFQPEHEAAMNKLMEKQTDAKPGQMFGYPGYKVNGKLAVGLFSNGIIVKVGKEKAAKLIADGKAETFEPMPGRAWKDWVLLTDNFDASAKLFKDAVALVKKETAG
jgi:hypothetical protein